ncbi:MAG: AmmeMemoRadiSam system protein A [Candidatus Micrarchaeota archaeon]
MEFTKEEERFLLGLARTAIQDYFKTGTVIDVKPQEIPSKRMTEDAATFVTLYIGEHLRGCIGSLEARRPLCLDVVNNAVYAAFNDPRFYELKPEELPKVKITISVLTPPKKMKVKNWQEFFEKLIPDKHGVIMKNGFHTATYLPAVWEQIPDKTEFMSELSIKAGMSKDGWKEPDTEFFVYEAIEISE